MVAVQEMKKSTQNAQHHHHHHHHHVHHQRHQQIIGGGGGGGDGCGSEQQSDSGEDLSYGPGIVEKLRDRYLSWATRESLVEKQRRSLETLRRATSLSTLLDREPQQHIIDEEDTEQLQQQQQQQQQSVAAQRPGNQQQKISGGILKSTTAVAQQQVTAVAAAEVMKKTATFESKDAQERLTRSQYENSTRGSRHLKRGNDSLKRARSVEALLSERAAWNFNVTRYSVGNNGSTGLDVTIEDKINNGRDRLLQGTDVMPPKRLTSIIDETERPPPDLVKQTLKKFEATANRRPRTPRANGKGEVASKVATFKSIIKENKAPVVLPKPTSPVKRLADSSTGAALKPITLKPVAAPGDDSLTSPTGRRLVTLKNSNLSDHTPDLIPRQRQLLEPTTPADSPVTALTKKLERMRIKTGETHVTDSPVSALTKRIEKMRISAAETRSTPQATSCAGDTTSDKDRMPSENANENKPHNKDHKTDNDSKQLVGDDDRRAASSTSNNNNNNHHSCKRDVVEVLVDKQHDDHAAAAAAAVATVPADSAQTGIASPSSVFSDDEGSLGSTKRVSRRALDNIAKAGSTQQFKFANCAQPTHENVGQVAKQLEVQTGQVVGQEEEEEEVTHNMRPLLGTPTTNTASVKQKNSSASSPSPSPLTSREIEKNRINELKKTSAALADSTANNSVAAAVSGSSLDNVIQIQQKTAAGQSELDAAAAGASPLWGAKCKRRVAPPTAVNENTTMVFNFSNRKEVPDYIENDGVIFRRKRELPKVRVNQVPQNISTMSAS